MGRGTRGPSLQLSRRMPSQPGGCWRPVGTSELDDGGSWGGSRGTLAMCTAIRNLRHKKKEEKPRVRESSRQEAGILPLANCLP